MSPTYEVLMFTGDYRSRQREAEAEEVDLYIEYYFNSYLANTNYTLAKIKNNGCKVSKAFAATHTNLVSIEFGIPLYDPSSSKSSKSGPSTPGVVETDNTRYVHTINTLKVPCCILEPLFITNPSHVAELITKRGVERLAQILVRSIKTVFPKGATIGLSVGHKYQRCNPMARGGLLVNYPEYTEADVSDTILILTKAYLETAP